MPRYAVTAKAGRFVAGTNNRGVGTILELTEKQAAHELRLGTIVPVGADAKETDHPEKEPAKAEEKAPAKDEKKD
jgi:hypothetical protein